MQNCEKHPHYYRGYIPDCPHCAERSLRREFREDARHRRRSQWVLRTKWYRALPEFNQWMRWLIPCDTPILNMLQRLPPDGKACP